MIIEILGKFYDNHSLSIVNRELAIALSEIYEHVQIKPLDSPNKEPMAITQKELDKLVELQTIQGIPDIQLRHFYPPIWSWPEYDITKIVYIQPWEFPKVPFEWQYKFETFADALIVPSNYTYSAFYNAGINPKNLYAIHNGYNDKVFNKNPTKPHSLVDKNKFTFVYMGNAQWRKGLDLLLNAWAQAFVKADNVELIIKDNASIYGKNNILNEIIKLQYKSGCGSIKYTKENMSQQDLAALYKSADSIVHPYRAEGFAMHIQEAVACGCIPIISDKGPTAEFIPSYVGYHVHTQPKAININDPNVFALKPGDSSTLMNSHTFMNEPDINSLTNGLRALYHAHNRQNYIDKLDSFELRNTWSYIANQYLSALREVNTREGVRRLK